MAIEQQWVCTECEETFNEDPGDECPICEEDEELCEECGEEIGNCTCDDEEDDDEDEDEEDDEE